MQILQDLAVITGFKATSDLPDWLTPTERAAMDKFLRTRSTVKQTGRYTFEIDGRYVDFSAWMPLPRQLNPPEKILAAFLGWLANMPWVLRLFDRLSRQAIAKAVREKE